ncbi:Choline transporter-like protein [Trichinella spiralis]|uniref:Choline transporter-like protein n=1 Tax=Trichinella spiralis TaxID=6334 RepID=A0ABR3KFE1_TRISP
MKVVHSSLSLVRTMPCSRGSRFARRFSQSSKGSHKRSRSASGSRSRKLSRSRSQSEKHSARQSLSRSSGSELQKIPSAVPSDGNESSLELICSVCLQSFRYQKSN